MGGGRTDRHIAPGISYARRCAYDEACQHADAAALGDPAEAAKRLRDRACTAVTAARRRTDEDAEQSACQRTNQRALHVRAARIDLQAIYRIAGYENRIARHLASFQPQHQRV